ncbi:MAG: glutamyl-tRNA reductase [Saprospiraceae bacterium]
MLNAYRLFTLTHRQAALDQLEPYTIPAEAMDSTLRRLREQLGWKEVFYLATCNRVLFFFYEEDRDPTTLSELRKALGIADTDDVVKPLFLSGTDAVLHLYDVAASVDSMVVGEREILRQLRLAYLACHEGGHCGDHLRILMQSAVAAAKTVYHKTKIGQKPVSVVSLAAQRIRQQRLDPTTARVLMIGAGQTNWLVSKFLQKQGFTNVTVANRSLENAEKLAAVFNGYATSLDALGDYDQGFDLLVVCTGATKAVVDPALFAKLLNGEAAEDKVVVDLSVPHNVDAQVIEKYAPTYIQIDDLRNLAQENLAFRSGEVTEARKFIGEQLATFRARVQQRRIELAMKDVPSEIRSIRKRAMRVVFQRELADLDGDTIELIERMMHYMEKKCIGIPMKAAREAAKPLEEIDLLEEIEVVNSTELLKEPT